MHIELATHALNGTMMFKSPIDDIARLLDEKIPGYIDEIVEFMDTCSKDELIDFIGYEMVGEWDNEYYEENKQDLMVFMASEIYESYEFGKGVPYLMYIFFFMQYRKLTGKNLRKGMKFIDILEEYKQIDDERIWTAFVYNDDLEGERHYDIYLYDGEELDYCEVEGPLYVDAIIEKQYEKLMKVDFFDNKIQHLRNISFLRYVLPTWFNYEADEDTEIKPKSIEEEIKELISASIDIGTNNCVRELCKNISTEDKKASINKLNMVIQEKYGRIIWYKRDVRRFVYADVPKYISEKEFLELKYKKQYEKEAMIIYKFLYEQGEEKYICELVSCLKHSFRYIDNEAIKISNHDEAIEELFILSRKLIDFYKPVFEVIARVKDEIGLVGKKNPYDIYKDLDIETIAGVKMNAVIPPTDAWLLQEQIYVCASLFYEFCLIFHLQTQVLNSCGDKVKCKQIVNEYRYMFKNMINLVFSDYLAADTFVENKKYGEIKKQQEGSLTNGVAIDFLSSLDKMLETDNVIELIASKTIMINALKIMGADEIIVENVIDKLIDVIRKKCECNCGFKHIYEQVLLEMKSYPVHISDTSLNTLATAEYFYQAYIIDKKEWEKFDYSCFSILYFQVLEAAINELLYFPYKDKFETIILKQANEDISKIEELSCIPPRVTNLVTKKSGKYVLAEQLTLGGLAYFCLGMSYNKEKIELIRFVREVFGDKNFDVDSMVKFGKEVLEISKRRNLAAHASQNMTAESFIESKDYVYNKELTKELKNLLCRFMFFFKAK